MKKNKYLLVLVAFILSGSAIAGVVNHAQTIKANSVKFIQGAEKNKMDNLERLADNFNRYSPYIELSGTRLFNTKGGKYASSLDLFVPLWQSQDNHLFFAQIRAYDQIGTPFEGNIHIGYRHLSSKQDCLSGIYGAFDYKRSDLGNYFKQITVGIERWHQKLFFGGNIYVPIGNRTKNAGLAKEHQLYFSENNIFFTLDNRHEKAAAGADLTLGYEFAEGLMGYVGGYWFGDYDIKNKDIYGPTAKLAYNFSLSSGKKIVNLFDKVGLEVGAQKGKEGGIAWFLNANFRIGMPSSNNNQLKGLSRHMIDLIRRDVDIVTTEYTKRSTKKYGINDSNLVLGKFKGAGSLMFISPVTGNKYLLPEALSTSDKAMVQLQQNSGGNNATAIIVPFSGSTNSETKKVAQDSIWFCSADVFSFCNIGSNSATAEQNKETVFNNAYNGYNNGTCVNEGYGNNINTNTNSTIVGFEVNNGTCNIAEYKQTTSSNHTLNN